MKVICHCRRCGNALNNYAIRVELPDTVIIDLYSCVHCEQAAKKVRDEIGDKVKEFVECELRDREYDL